MNKELEIWQFAAEKLTQNVPAMLLIVVESSGSSPGRRGFKMAVAADEIVGSIGGGVMEVELVEEARRFLSVAPASAGAQNSWLKHQVHQKNSPTPSGMICSGKQTVLFFKLQHENLRGIRQIINALRYGRGGHLSITSNYIGRNPKRPIVQEAGTNFKASDENFIYEESLAHKNRLTIIGGGHCALALSELMSRMDFYISIFDDRPNLNTIEKNEFANEITIIENYENIAEMVASGEDNYVVAMTLGYKSDEIVIRKLLDKNFKYFGVLGSKAKMAILLNTLKKEGIAESKLSGIRTPIGLPINSQTPEEIAVSIAAEIIAVKNFAK